MPEPHMPAPRTADRDPARPPPLLCRAAVVPAERRRGLAFLARHAALPPNANGEVILLYDPADDDLAGAALIAVLCSTTLGVLSCRTGWIDERGSLRRLLEAIADRGRTHDATFLAVRTATGDEALRAVIFEMGFLRTHAFGSEVCVPHEPGIASWFAHRL